MSWRNAAPSAYIVIDRLPGNMRDREVAGVLNDMGTNFLDLHYSNPLGRHDTGKVYIEFSNSLLASVWMNTQQGVLKLAGTSCPLTYANRPPDPELWRCVCGFANSQSKQMCVKCNRHVSASQKPVAPKRLVSRTESPPRRPSSSRSGPTPVPPVEPPPSRPRAPPSKPAPVDEGASQIGINPCNTVLLRGLDGLSDEKRILNALARITSLAPKNCFVMRHLETGVSMGYGFMEFDSAANGKRIVDYFNARDPFEVDGKLLLVDFAKNTLPTILKGVKAAKESLEKAKYQQEEEARQLRELEERERAEEVMRLKGEEILRRAQAHIAKRQKQSTFRNRSPPRREPSPNTEVTRDGHRLRNADPPAPSKEDLKTTANSLLERVRMKKDLEKQEQEQRAAEELVRAEQAKALEERRKEIEQRVASVKIVEEEMTGHKYAAETGLYLVSQSSLAGPEKFAFVGHSMAKSLDLRAFDEREIIPNGRLEDLVTAALRLLDIKALHQFRVCCYFFFGVTDLLDVKQGNGYREVVLRDSGDVLLLSKIQWASNTLQERNILPLFCTFPPMSFAKHNAFLLKNKITKQLREEESYPKMQLLLNKQVANINMAIDEINCTNGMITCQLAAKIFSNENGVYILRDAFLRDGLHPSANATTLLNLEVAQNLRKAKQGKRSPEWLKKSLRTQPSAPVSFALKKKEDKLPLLQNPPISEARGDRESRSKYGKYEIVRQDRPNRASSPARNRSRSRSRDRSRGASGAALLATPKKGLLGDQPNSNSKSSDIPMDKVQQMLSMQLPNTDPSPEFQAALNQLMNNPPAIVNAPSGTQFPPGGFQNSGPVNPMMGNMMGMNPMGNFNVMNPGTGPNQMGPGMGWQNNAGMGNNMMNNNGFLGGPGFHRMGNNRF